MIPRLVCGLKVLSKLFLVSDAAEYVAEQQRQTLCLQSKETLTLCLSSHMVYVQSTHLLAKRGFENVGYNMQGIIKLLVSLHHIQFFQWLTRSAFETHQLAVMSVLHHS